MINDIKIKRNKITLLLSVIPIILMIIYNYSSNNMILVAILLSALFLINRPIYLLPSLFVSSIISSHFIFMGTMNFTNIIMFIFIVLSLFFFFRNNIKIRTKHVLAICLLICFNLFSASSSITGSFVPGVWISLYIILMFFIGYSQIDNIRIFYNSFNINLIIMGFYMIYLIIYKSALDFEGRLVFGGLNANRAGMSLAILFVSLFSLTIIGSSKILKLLSIATLIPLVFFMLKVGSRTALISIIFSLLLGGVFFLMISRKYSFKILNISVIVIILSLIYMNIMNISFDSDRFLWQSIVDTGGTGRVFIWREMIRYVMSHNPVLGIGLINNTVSSIGSHNLFVFLIYQMGIIGAVIYISFFSWITVKLVKSYLSGKMPMLILPLIMFLQMISNGIGEDIFYEFPLWFVMGFGLLFINNYKARLN